MTAEAIAEWFRSAGPEGALVFPHFLTMPYEELFESGLDFLLDGLRTRLVEQEAAKPSRRRA